MYKAYQTMHQKLRNMFYQIVQMRQGHGTNAKVFTGKDMHYISFSIHVAVCFCMCNTPKDIETHCLHYFDTKWEKKFSGTSQRMPFSEKLYEIQPLLCPVQIPQSHDIQRACTTDLPAMHVVLASFPCVSKVALSRRPMAIYIVYFYILKGLSRGCIFLYLSYCRNLLPFFLLIKVLCLQVMVKRRG